MDKLRHGNSTTRLAARAAGQQSQALIVVLSHELGINLKTVVKRWERVTVDEINTGLAKRRSLILTEAYEDIVVAFRSHTLLSWMTASTPIFHPASDTVSSGPTSPTSQQPTTRSTAKDTERPYTQPTHLQNLDSTPDKLIVNSILQMSELRSGPVNPLERRLAA